MTEDKPVPLSGNSISRRIRKTAASVSGSLEVASGAAAAATRKGVARATGDLTASGVVAKEKGREVISSGASGIAAGFTVANETLTEFARNLDWNTINPSQYLYVGTRGISRGMEEARIVWESIPEQLRALGPEELARHLDGFDWSHVVPHIRGGGSEAANGLFERASVNRSRGAEQMTGAEIAAAVNVLSDVAFDAALNKVASSAFSGAMAGIAVSCVVSCLEHGLEYQRGKITKKEMYQRIAGNMTRSAGCGGAVSGVMAVVALAFPALIPLAAPLMMPLAVLGFCAVGGKVVHLGKGWYELYQSVSDDTTMDMESSPRELT